MSNTRKAPEGGAFRPDRFASSEAFTSGIPANLVARRCSVLPLPADRELLYWLQFQSHARDGLDGLAKQLLREHAADLGTVTMHAVGMRQGQLYDAATCGKVRAELPSGLQDMASLQAQGSVSDLYEAGFLFREGSSHRDFPSKISASAFLEVCREASAGLSDFLCEVCVNPEIPMVPGSPWYFPALFERLRECMQADQATARARGADTQVAERVDESLDYALQQRCMVVVEGKGRIGKTFACRRWCDAHSGRARFVSVPSCTDAIAFYRAIAKALGVASALSLKLTQLRDRVEATLLAGDLMLVFDEGWALFPQRGRPREAMPARLSWIMTALQNNSIPVAICSTPQFMKSQRAYTAATHWSSEQFIGRIAHFEKLPDSIPTRDLEAVARRLLPEADDACIAGLVAYAGVTDKGLAGIEFTEKRARFLAHKAGRLSPSTEDVAIAIRESGLPSESALARALGMRSASSSMACKTSATAVPMGGKPSYQAPTAPVKKALARVAVTANV